MNKYRNNYRVLAEEFYYNGKLNLAIDFYKRALSYRGDKDDTSLILFNLGVIYWEMDDLKKARYYYNRVLENDPDYKDAYYQLGLLSEDMGNKHKAITYYRKALRIDKNDTPSIYNLAVIYDSIGRDYLSESMYLKLLKLDPGNSYALNNIGSIYESRGEYDKAFKYLSKSIELNDEFYLSHFNMGVVLKAMRRDNEAIKHYNISMELKPDYEYTYLNLSALYIEKKDYLKSIEVLSKGIKECSINHDLYYNRACSYAILKNRDKALKDIEKCLALSHKLIRWVDRDKDFDDLRDDIDFINILNNAKNKVRKELGNDYYKDTR